MAEMLPRLVSIIMPVYNGEQYLRQAIDSALAQSYPEWELVVVDDGSSDGTAEIVQSYSDPRVRYTYQENRGQAAALNRGLELARGEFVTTLDADDWLPPNSLQDRLACMTEHPEFGVVYGDGNYCNAAGETVLRFTEHMPSGVTGDVYETLIVSPFYGTGAAVLVRRQLIERFQIYYDEAIVWCQDWDFYIRLAEKAHFGFVPSVVIFYRLHSAGMTLTMPSGRRLESLLRLRFKVLASPRFLQASEAQKAAFFYDFLVKDLNGRVSDQERVFASPAYGSMSSPQASRLLRLTAIEYLLQLENIPTVRRWLAAAWRRSPLEPRNAVATLLCYLSPALAKKVVLRWKHSLGLRQQTSPFEMAGASVGSVSKG
jgi:glycosyltransferase involved in cell wall biosynthesis